MSIVMRRAAVGIAFQSGLCLFLVVCALGDEGQPRDGQPLTGPETEARFPPLVLPQGFKATLFACDPMVEYPSAVAVGPQPGSIFVAAEFVSGLGSEIVRRGEVRLLEDGNGDGYAERSTIFAGGFNSIQGLAWHGGTVYVMHAPLLTSLKDGDGDGVAETRKDLHSGLGLPPEKNPSRLHCANGVIMGHDGWLYLALGDNGADVMRPEGDRLVFEGGGILRCRADGSDLHVFAIGLRNIYDVALDDDLNVFVRDNENDGGDYKIRLIHSFFGADHGYPYLYNERPDESMPPVADMGLGSSAGGLCYREPLFGPQYAGRLFFCEWGRAVVSYQRQRAGSGFAHASEMDFASGSPNDLYPFKPTDLAVMHDGSLIVTDWADGQQPKRGRGRVYRIVPEDAPHDTGEASKTRDGLDALISDLDSASAYRRVEAQEALGLVGPNGEIGGLAAVRQVLAVGRLGMMGRMHVVWILARGAGRQATGELLKLARRDPEPRVRVQAIRAIADLADPVFIEHRLDAPRGDRELAARLAALAADQGPPVQGNTVQDPRVVREVVVALGRLRWADAPAWLAKTLNNPDPPLAHAAMYAIRRSENWKAALKLLDLPDSHPLRAIALRALVGRYQPAVADGLIARMKSDTEPAHRQQYADVLARLYKRPAPWVYWGYRPLPRPAHTQAWDRSEAIAQALDGALADPKSDVRLAVLRRMQREKVPARLDSLAAWLEKERAVDAVTAIIESLRDYPAAEARGPLAAIVSDPTHDAVSRTAALVLYCMGVDESSKVQLADLVRGIEDGPVLARALEQSAAVLKLESAPLLVDKLRSESAAVRAAAMDMVAQLEITGQEDEVCRMLDDPDPEARRAAASAAGKLRVAAAVEPLLALAGDPLPQIRTASLESLRLLGEPRAVELAVRSLEDEQTQVAALALIGDLGDASLGEHVVRLALETTSSEIQSLALPALSKWSGQPNLPEARQQELAKAVARIQGASGSLVCWRVTGPVESKDVSAIIEQFGISGSAAPEPPGRRRPWQALFALGTESKLSIAARPSGGTSSPGGAPDAQTVWLAWTDVSVEEPAFVQMLGASNGTYAVWLNGARLYQREQATAFQADADRFETTLAAGANRLLVEIHMAADPAEFQLRFRRKSSKAEHEQLVQSALANGGDAERGRQVFFNADKSQCIKCHRLGEQGERVGPEMSRVGSRFSRIHLIESILEPSRTIAPSFGSVVLVLSDGRVLTGIRTLETETDLTLVDNLGNKHPVSKADIDETQPYSTSTMPEGLEKKLTSQEFVDLIAFLASQQ